MAEPTREEAAQVTELRSGDKVFYGNGEWVVESVGAATVTIAQLRRDWRGEDAICVATVPREEVTL